MKLFIYSIFDSKVGAYSRPFYEFSKGSAIRAITEALNDPKTTFAKYPADFNLFELGTFDELSGVIDLHSCPMSIGCLAEFVVNNAAQVNSN